MTTVVLASTSRYRAELLERLGIPFATQAPEVDETPEADEPPRALVQRLAVAKATAVAEMRGSGLIIGSDQVAVCGPEILGKPGTEPVARDQLSRLSGREVVFLTGLAVVDAGAGVTLAQVVETPVRFRPLNSEQIAAYVTREQPLDCAGAFKSEGLGIALFEAVGGNDPTALIGLPLIELCSMLGARGYDVLGSG